MTFIDEVEDVNLESVVKNAKNQDNPELAVFSFGPQPGEKSWTVNVLNDAQEEIMDIIATGGPLSWRCNEHIDCACFASCIECQAARIEDLFAEDKATIKILEDALVSTAHLLQQMSTQIVSPADTPIHKLLRKVDNALNQARKG